MEDAHRESLPVLRSAAAGLTEQIKAGGAADDNRAGAGRRRFLLGAGGAGAAFLLAACSGGKGSSTPSPSSVDSARAVADTSPYTGDLKIVALATALENQAVDTYRSALAAAKAGKLGTVPPAVAAFITKAMAQHIDHADAWNAILTGAGKPAINNVPLSNQKQVTDALGKATSVGAVAKLALQLEDQAAQTYFFTTFNVKNAAAINAAAGIGPVEAMHASILHFVLGQYPVPDTFLPVDKAAKPSLLTV
jgi:hypothetical protein